MDLVTHDPNFNYDQYGIHVGQVDRLTFLGPPTQTINGYFVDCRKGSPTLHQTVELTYWPSPDRKLVIGRGIAHTFDGLQNIVTVDEPIHFVAEGNPDYNLYNDVVNFPRTFTPDLWPLVRTNDLPIPVECYRFITDKQHKLFSAGGVTYPVRFQVELGGERRYVVAIPKHGTMTASDANGLGMSQAPTHIDGVEWGANYFASSGISSADTSFYVIRNPHCEMKELLHFGSEIDGSSIGPHEYPVMLTVLGDPQTAVRVDLVDRRVSSPTETEQATIMLSPDPTRHLFIQGGIQYTLSSSTWMIVRVEKASRVGELENGTTLSLSETGAQI